MEIQAVVEHEPLDKWVEWEAWSAEEMGEEHHLLMGPGGGDELPLVWELVRNVVDKYPAFLNFLRCPSVTEEAIHLPPALDMAGEG